MEQGNQTDKGSNQTVNLEGGDGLGDPNGGVGQGIATDGTAVSAETDKGTVPLTALLEEQKKYQNTRDELTTTKSRLGNVEAALQELQNPQSDLDDDDIITVADHRKSLQSLKNELLGDLKKQTTLTRVETSVEKARSKYSKSAFTFEEAERVAKDSLSQAQLRAIGEDKNPGELLYNITFNSPGVQESIRLKVLADAARKEAGVITDNVNQPLTLSDASKGATRQLDGKKAIENMTPEDIRKMGDMVIKKHREG